MKLATKRKMVRMRRFFRHPITTVVAYLAFLVSVCVLLSRTFLNQYLFWQIVPVLSSLATSILAIAGGIGIVWFFSQASSVSGVNLKKSIRNLFWKGYPALFFVTIFVLCSFASFVTKPKEYLSEVIDLLKCRFEHVSPAHKRLEEIKSFPRYAKNIELTLLSSIVLYLENSDSWKKSDHQKFLETIDLSKFSDKSIIKAWILLLMGESFDYLGKPDDSSRCYRQIINLRLQDTYTERVGFRRLGNIQFNRGQEEAALEFWLLSAQLGPCIDTFNNIAIFYQRNGEYEKAETYYEKIASELERLQVAPICPSVPLRELKADLYVDRANLYRYWSHSKQFSNRAESLRRDAYKFIENAKDADPGYISLYWTGCHIAISFGEYKAALAYVLDSLNVLNNREEYDLDRYRKFQFQLYGIPYAAWLELRIVFLSDNSVNVPKDRIDKLLDVIPGFRQQPFEKATELFRNISATGYTVNDDKNTLDDMRRHNFLRIFE